jgi:hypothetical protein
MLLDNPDIVLILVEIECLDREKHHLVLALELKKAFDMLQDCFRETEHDTNQTYHKQELLGTLTSLPAYRDPIRE